MTPKEKALIGCLLGTAVGDALGLPWEGLASRRIAQRIGDGNIRYRFIFGRGMVSDDTEHAVLVAQAILGSGCGNSTFQKDLSWRLRWWLLGLPAGIGLATLKSCLRLWMGIPADRSGVNSAGNGSAVRAPIIGVCFAIDIEYLIRTCDESSKLTHTDPRAVCGARVVALAARSATLGLSLDDYFSSVENFVDTCEPWIEMIAKLQVAHARGQSLEDFSRSIGRPDRVTGFVMHSVPVALYAWMLHRDDLRCAVEELIRLGGDTDTTAAIAGALCGASGAEIPEDLVRGLWEWPRSVKWMRQLASRLATNEGPVPVMWPLIPLRNATFTLTVLTHGLKRVIGL